MKKIFNLLMVLATLTGLSSCLDEDPVFDGDKSENIIEIEYVGTSYGAFPTGTTFPVYTFSFPIVEGEEVEIPVYINYAGAHVAPEDITVTISPDPSALTNHNESTDSEYEFLPESMYSIPSTSVTIPKGERTVMLPIKVRPDLFDPAAKYALAISISNVSTGKVSANFKTAIMPVGAKNKYDGAYTFQFAQTIPNGDRPTFDATGTVWTWPGDVWLVTSGANKVNLYDTWGYEDYIHPLRTTTGWSGLGSTNLTLEFDINTNEIISISNAVANPSNGRSFVMDPSGPNYYDPETGIIYATYFLNQPGYGPIRYSSKFTYKAVRP